MNKEETKRLINVLYVAYPSTYNGWKESRFNVFADLMAETFKNVPVEVVMKAIKKEIAENRTNFAPSIGEIMYQVKNLISVFDADAQWDEVAYIVRAVNFEDVPQAVRTLDKISQGIVSSRDIQRMKETAGAMDRERPRFIAAYNREKEKREAEAVETGNLLAISDENRLTAIGAEKQALQIGHSEEN